MRFKLSRFLTINWEISLLIFNNLFVFRFFSLSSRSEMSCALKLNVDVVQG